MTIKVKYEVAVDGGTGYSVTKSFDTLCEAKDYEAALALAEFITECPDVYVAGNSAEALAIYIIKRMKEANEAARAEAEANAAWKGLAAAQQAEEPTL